MNRGKPSTYFPVEDHQRFFVKAGRENFLIGHLHEVLLQCWEEGTIPHDMWDAKIGTFYKNKSDRSDCNSYYRRISLLSIVGKDARVVLNCSPHDSVYLESQCGFRAQQSRMDKVFSLRQLQGNHREQRRPLFLGFIDLTKVFELVSLSGLFTLLYVGLDVPPSS